MTERFAPLPYPLRSFPSPKSNLTKSITPNDNRSAKELAPGGLEALIARVVSEVIASQVKPSAGKPQPFEAATSSSVPAKKFDATFDGAVLSLAQLPQVPKGGTLRVSATTVVTPSVRDALRTARIKLVRGGTSGYAQPKGVAAWIADSDGLRRCAPVSQQLSQRGVSARGCGYEELQQRLIETQHADLPPRGIVLTDLPAPIVYQLHRKGLVAAQVTHAETLDEIEQAFRPSVWVVDVRNQSLGSAVNLVARCLQVSAASVASRTTRISGGTA